MASTEATASSAEGLTPAQQLQQQHDNDHHVTVEDVPDEEDLAHPPPSTKPAADAPLSEKAAGKQKAESAASVPAPAPKKPVLNMASEELFPTLGSVKPRTNASPMKWGKMPAAVTSSNGLNGTAPSTYPGGLALRISRHLADLSQATPPLAHPLRPLALAWAPLCPVVALLSRR
jgi:hypothetical protein